MPGARYQRFAKGGIGGGDGHDYFAILPPVPQLIEAIQYLDDARTKFLRGPDKVEGKVQATAVDYVIKEVTDKVKLAGKTASIETTALIRDLIEKSKKRPDRPSGGGLRLKDAVVCRALPTVIPGGGVGVGDIAVLQAVVGKDRQPFWLTQEFGSSHLLGHEVFGFFESPGRAYPNPAEFRTHAIFNPSAKGRRMTVNRPIPERAFMREGSELGDQLRMKLLGDAVRQGTRELLAIADGTSARLAPLRRVVR